MPSELEAAALRFRSQLLRQERQAASEMVRAYATAWAHVRDELAGLQAQINAARAAGLIPDTFQPREPGGPVIPRTPGTFSPSWLWERDRLTALQRQIEAELRQFAALAGELTETGQLLAVQAAQANSQALVTQAARSAGAPELVGMFDRLPRDAVQDLVGFAADGSPLRRLFENLGPVVGRGVQDALVTAVATGMGPRETARLVRSQFGMGLNRALTIARTEQLRAYREASRRSYEANEDLLDGWIWLSAHDGRTCLSCWAMHGTRHPVTETLDDHPRGRCVMVPVVKGHDPRIPTGEELFKELPVGEQRRILGPAAHEAYRAGAVAFGDFAGQRDNPQWGTMRYAKSLREVLGPEKAERWLSLAHKRRLWQPTVNKIQQLTDRREVLPLGQLPASVQKTIQQQWPTSITKNIVLTGERRAHYLERHEEMAAIEADLMAVLFDPDEVHRNRYDSRVAIFYRRLDQEHFLRVAMWISDDQTKQNSVFSFRKTRHSEIERDRKEKRQVWKKK